MLSVKLKVFRTKVDIKSIIRDYSLIKAVFAAGPKSRRKKGKQTVCDIEIKGTKYVCI